MTNIINIDFKKKPKKINVYDVDAIVIMFKNGDGVIVPKKYHRGILEVLSVNNADYYIDE